MFGTSVSGVLKSAVVGLSLLALATPASAEGYPERDVTIIVQSSAGGGSDIFARTVANLIQKEELLPVPLLVENRPGGGGAIAYNYVAQRKGDPYYIGTIASSFFVAPLMGQSPTTYKDFTPLAVIAGDPFVLVVEANSDVQSLDDLKNKGSVRVGNTGPVTDPAFLGAQLGEALGIEVRAVPFNGDGEVTTALLGGHIDLQFGNTSEVIGQIEAGRVRPIAVTSTSRLSSLPDVPTFEELGYDIQLMLYRGFVMPADAPAEAVAYWGDVLKKVADSEAWRTEYVERNNLVPLYWGPEEFAQRVPQISDLYEAYLKSVGAIN